MSGAEALRVSLNEVELALRRAALGAGLPQGHAEDFGAAAAWLCRHGFAGAELALASLEAWNAGETAAVELRCDARGDRLSAAGGRPAAAWSAGPAAADLLRAGAGGCRSLVLARAERPLLVLAVLGLYSAAGGPALALAWPGGRALCRDGGAALVAGGWRALARTPLADLTAARAGRAPGRPPVRLAPAPLDRGAAVARESWARIAALGRRSLVPASAGSRAAGAGAGLSDKD